MSGLFFKPPESRVQFSSSVAAAAPPLDAPAPAAVRRSSDTSTVGLPTRTDRRALIAKFSGALAGSLRKTLRPSGDAAFDDSLLDYMVHRAGPFYFYNGRQLPRYADFVNQILPQEVASTLDKADAILAHRFPEQINSETYTIQLGTAIDWDVAPRTTDNPDFLDRVTPSSVLKNRTAIHAAGLLRVALMFPEFTLAAAWATHGVDLTFRWLGAQFYPDGGHVEETPSYQASALDAFLETYKLSELNGRTYWTKNRRRILTNSVESLYQELSPHGQIPGLSDTYRSANPGPFLTLCGLLLGDRRYLIARPSIDQVLVVGRDLLLANYVGDPNRLNDRGPSYALPDTGYYMLRGAESFDPSTGTIANVQLIADAGPKGGT